jgi:exodeoxyribonuclease VII large subunit
VKRPPQSQWDFGELFPSAAARRVFSVTELTGLVKRTLEGQFGEIWVAGEVSNLRHQASGHSYFTLKDAGAQLSCVLFRNQGRIYRDLLEDGRKINLRGQLTVYEPRGRYQIIVAEIELQGLGALQQAFERLKARLAAEGLFDPARKRPLPRFPQRIGLVTSPTGAALRDILTVVRRRHPALELVLAPCRVQGQGAAEEIADAIRLLNAFNTTPPAPTCSGAAPASGHAPRRQPLDVILVTRGGGSLEDLWAFNEEPVARAIAASTLPVVSAIGHEIDFTIADFVADLRAPTPSAAAEILTEGAFASRQLLAEGRTRLRRLAERRLELEHDLLRQTQHRLHRCHPRRRLDDQWQRLDEARATLARTTRLRLRAARSAWRALAARWIALRPRPVLDRQRVGLAVLAQRLAKLVRLHTLSRRQTLATTIARLHLLSPLNVLARGYSITRDATTGHVVRHATRVTPGQRLRTRLETGEIDSIAQPPSPER